MRTRSEAKRREIIAVAAQAFEEIGYERTSMLTIAERLRGSKQTLYNYFPSKEDLLRAVLSDRVMAVADSALDWFMDAARQMEESARGLDSRRRGLSHRPALPDNDRAHADRGQPAGRQRLGRPIL